MASTPRASKISFQFNGSPGFQFVAYIPLVQDKESHAYTYDLKLMEVNHNTKLTGFELDPIRLVNKSNQSAIQISDIRLILKQNRLFRGESATCK